MEDCGERKKRAGGNLGEPDVEAPGLKRARVAPGSPVGGSPEPETETDRVDSDEGVKSSVCELARLDSSGSSVNSNGSEHLAVGSLNSPEAKRIQDDLLNMLEESDAVPDRDLDWVMRSFEEEIMVRGPRPSAELQAGAEQGTGLGDSQPDLGYLLEASDDELGLPPSGTTGSVEESFDESVRGVPESMSFNGFMGFDDVIPSYDSLEFGIITELGNSNTAEFATYDGLFDYSEPGEGLWRYESSLQAL